VLIEGLSVGFVSIDTDSPEFGACQDMPWKKGEKEKMKNCFKKLARDTKRELDLMKGQKTRR
jgi:hypothetical protein